MDACEAVEKELSRVITKFNGVHDHAKRVLGDVTKNFEELQSSIAEGTYKTFIVQSKKNTKTKYLNVHNL